MKRIIIFTLAVLALVSPLTTLAQLDPAEAGTLQWMREEEKLARDVYVELYAAWALPTFSNIAQSEQRHMDALLVELEFFGLEDPVQDDTVGVFSDPVLAGLFSDLVRRGGESLLEALRVGAFIEELDIADLWEAIDETDEPGLESAYENLLAGSRNHLRAFVGQFESLGSDYQAQHLSQEEVDAIVGGYDLPESDFEISVGLNDAWYYPATPGQGFFITVYPLSQTVFLSWFTFDTVPGAESTKVGLGSSDQRWLTAQGRYEGAQADLQVYVTAGGLFDSEEPLPETVPDGSILLNFDNCNSGMVSYDIPSIGLNGVIPIERVAADNVAHCENMGGNSATN